MYTFLFAIIGVGLSTLSLFLVCHLGTLHNNLVSELREFKERWDYNGDPLPDDEIDRLVEIATGKRPVDEPPGVARCLACDELGHDCPVHEMGKVKDEEQP